MLFKFISIIAAFLTTASFIPQAVKTIKTRDTAGISAEMYIMFTVGVLLWAIYGIYIRDAAIISANVITFMFAAVILTCKVINLKNGKDR